MMHSRALRAGLDVFNITSNQLALSGASINPWLICVNGSCLVVCDPVERALTNTHCA